MGQMRFDIGTGIDEITAVEGVFFNSGCNGKHIWIKDNVRRRKIQASNQQIIAALTNRLFAFEIIGLAGFIESHHDNGGAIFQT